MWKYVTVHIVHGVYRITQFLKNNYIIIQLHQTDLEDPPSLHCKVFSNAGQFDVFADCVYTG